MAQMSLKRLICIILILIFSIPLPSVKASGQWFPEPEIECKYQLLSQYKWPNGTQVDDSNFQIFRDSEHYVISPIYAGYIGGTPPEWESIENTSEIYLTHSYIEKSDDTLTRNTSISTKTQDYGYMDFELSFAHSTGVTWSVDWASQSFDIQESHFHTTTKYNFPDYIDRSKMVNESVNDGFFVKYTNDSCIVALKDDTHYETITLIADGAGRVTSYMLFEIEWLSGCLISIRFELQPSESNNNDNSPTLLDRIINQDWIIVGSMLGIIFIIGLLIGIKSKKNAR